jgi:diguanylate cyclase (GGDEF)-like protein
MKKACPILLLLVFILLTCTYSNGEYTESHFFSYGTPSLGIYQQEFLNSYINIDPDLTKGYNLLVDFKFQEAAGILERVASDQYTAPAIRSEAYTYLGYAYLNIKELKQAEIKLTQALKLNNKNALAYFFLANVYFIDNNFEETKTNLHKAIEYRPNFVSAIRMLAETYKNEDNLDKSVFYYKKLTELQPYSGYYLFQYYKVLDIKRDYPEAIVVLKKMIEQEPRFLQNRINLGDIYAKMGRYDRAMEEFDNILKDNPRYSKAIAGKASIYLKKGDYVNAFKEIRRAKELESNNPFYKSLLAEIRKERAQQNKRIALATFFILLGILGVATLVYYYNSHKDKKYLLSVTNEFNKSVDNLYDQSSLLNYLMNFFLDIGSSRKGIILLFNRQNNQLAARESIGFEREIVKNFKMFAGEEITNWLTGLNNSLLTITDIEKDKKFDEVFPSLRDRLIEMNLNYIYPLREKTQFIGFIIVDDIDIKNCILPNYNDQLVQVLTTSGQALSNLSLYETSITDETTGLFNKRYFWQNLSTEIKRSERYGQPVSLLLFDIDNFKKLNDTYGHPQGDRVLRELGQLVINTYREGIDVGARIGGEEFAVILPSTEAPKAKLAAERLRKALHKHVFSGFPEGVEQKVTVSMGIATFPLHAPNSKKLVEKADEALYTAKRTGKDKVCLVGYYLENDKGLKIDNPQNDRYATSDLPEIDSEFIIDPDNRVQVSPLMDKNTGLFSKDYFYERLMGELRRSERTSRSCSVFLMCPDSEIPDKQRNDFLSEISKILKTNLRKGIDVAAMIDQEIIAVLIPEADQNKAAQIARRIKNLIKKSGGVRAISETTFSIGVSSYPSFGKTESSLLESAKHALKICQEMGGDKALITTQIL